MLLCNGGADPWRSCCHCRSWLEALCYQTVLIRVPEFTAGHWCAVGAKRSRTHALGELQAFKGKPCMLWNLAKWAHQSQKETSFLLGLIAHKRSPLTQFHCQLAKKKCLKGQIHFNRAGRKSKFGAEKQ